MSVGSMLLVGLAQLYPVDVDVSAELADSVTFLDSTHAPETYVRAGFGAGIVGAVAPVTLVLWLPWYGATFASLICSLSAIHVIQTLPHVQAAFKRTEALGDAPNLIGRAVLRMQIEPATESAVRFAADTGSSSLAANLSTHIDAAVGTPRTGLLSFAEEWADRFPAMRRSAYLLASAQQAPDGERARTLDRSLAAVLDGTRDRMAEFTNAIRGPTTMLYAFGVMVPLALVALVPAVGFVGYDISIWYLVVGYDIVLPIGLTGASLWLLKRRPIAFPPPKVTRSHPDVPSRLLPTLLWGAIGVIAGYTLVTVLGVTHLAPVTAAGLGIGAMLIAYVRPILHVRTHVREIESNLTDALYLTGRLVDDGKSVETAIQRAGDQVPAATGELFERAAGLQRRLHLSVQEAFLGEYGVVKDVPSPRVRATVELLAIAAEQGAPAGRAIVSMADHLDELRDVEAQTRRQLSTITDTIDNTATFFGPMVAGATVGLAGGLSNDGTAVLAEATTLPTDQLGLVIGGYVISLSFILVPLSVALEDGLDRPLIGYRVGRSLLGAVPIYVITVVVVGLTF
ncbi:secretion system protein [Halorhabdus sp. BNX81]|uniref:type II secretion system F family protein n=1 Tax=Halorhabdus sp. BNX81 TaxID=2980181 RepID=UPI0023DD48AF|nr:secretion system protein [Halorhabdus sp. BNX81]